MERGRQCRSCSSLTAKSELTACETPVVRPYVRRSHRSGLSMSAAAIGTAFSINGLWSITAQVLFLTRIRRYLGIARAYKVLSVGWVAVWLLLPQLRTLLEAVEEPLERENPYDPIRWVPLLELRPHIVGESADSQVSSCARMGHELRHQSDAVFRHGCGDGK